MASLEFSTDGSHNTAARSRQYLQEVLNFAVTEMDRVNFLRGFSLQDFNEVDKAILSPHCRREGGGRASQNCRLFK